LIGSLALLQLADVVFVCSPSNHAHASLARQPPAQSALICDLSSVLDFTPTQREVPDDDDQSSNKAISIQPYITDRIATKGCFSWQLICSTRKEKESNLKR